MTAKAPFTITMTANELTALMMSVVEKAISAHEAEKFKSHLSALTADTAKALIIGLAPDNEMSRGKEYLLALLEKQGVHALEKFVDKALEGIDEDGGLDFERHFSPTEKTIFAQGISNLKPLEPLPTISKTGRRAWLRTMVIAGAGLSLEGLVGVTETALDMHKPAKEGEPKWKAALRKVAEITDHIVAPITLLVIGAHYFHDTQVEEGRMVLENISEKLGHLEYAIDELAVQSKRAKTATSTVTL